MSENQLKALLLYRMQQADETFQEGEILFNQSAYRGTINRAYYAMFYSVLALLATKKLGTSKHSGVIGLFDREFVKTGFLPRDLSRALRLGPVKKLSFIFGRLWLRLAASVKFDLPTSRPAFCFLASLVLAQPKMKDNFFTGPKASASFRMLL